MQRGVTGVAISLTSLSSHYKHGPPSLPRCSPLRSSPFASSAPHPQLKVGNNANQSTLRRLRVSATPSHFPFRERKMHVDSRLRNLSGVSSNSGGALTRPSFLCRISWSPQIPNTSLSLSVVACCFVSERGKLFFHCAVFWGRRAGAAAKATASAAATNTHATSNRPHDQTPQTQRVAFLRYTRVRAHKPQPNCCPREKVPLYLTFKILFNENVPWPIKCRGVFSLLE